MNNQHTNLQYRPNPNQQRIPIPTYPVYPQQIPITPQNVQKRIIQNVQYSQNAQKAQNGPAINNIQQQVQNLQLPVQNVNTNYGRTAIEPNQRNMIKHPTFNLDTAQQQTVQPSKVVVHSFSKEQPVYFSAPQNQINGLIQPPTLSQNPRQSDTTYKQTIQSNLQVCQNENQQVTSSQNQNELRQIVWGQQQGLNNTFWQQKFFMVYQKFEWFGERFTQIREMYETLSQILSKVDSEQQWNELKHNHSLFGQRLEQMYEQFVALIKQNQLLISQRLNEEGQLVWQRRYHELLSNFKALKQQSNLMEQQYDNYRRQVGTPIQNQDQENLSENYQNLLNHCHQIEQEYDRILNENNLLKQEYEKLKVATSNPGSRNSGPTYQQFQSMRIQYERSIQEMQNEFKNDYGQLQTTCQQLYEEKQHLKEQMNAQQEKVDQTCEIDNLYKVIEQKQNNLKNLTDQNNEYKQRCEYLEHQLHQVNEVFLKQTQTKLREKTRELELALSSLDERANQEQVNRKKLILSLEQQYSSELSRLKIENERLSILTGNSNQEINQLRLQLDNFMKQSSSREMLKYQYQSLEKKVTFVEEENSILIESLKIKNHQLIELRNLSMDLSNYQNVLQRMKAFERQKFELQDIYQRDLGQVNILRKKINEFQNQIQRLREENNIYRDRNDKNFRFKQFQEEINAQKLLLMSKDSGINKMKQLLQSKQKYISEIQEQNLKSSAKIDHINIILQSQRNEAMNSISALKKKLETQQKKYRTFQIDFKRQMSENYEKQIGQLRKLNEQKLKKIKSMEEQLIEFRAKSEFNQKFTTKQNYISDNLQKKCQHLQSIKGQLLAKITVNEKQINLKNDENEVIKNRQVLMKKQINTYLIQIQQIDKLVKNKNNVILSYQKQVQKFMDKVKELEHLIKLQQSYHQEKSKKYEEEINTLKQQLYSPSNNGDNNENSRFSGAVYSHRQSPQKKRNIQKLQFSLIEQLNQQNSNLKKNIIELHKKLNSFETVSRVIQNSNKQSASLINENKSINIQQRLMKFNERLQICIQDNEGLSFKGIDLTASQKIAHYEREKRQLQNKYEQDVKSLINRIEELEVQVKELESKQQKASPDMDMDINEMTKYHLMAEHKQKSTLEELEYMKTKFNEQNRTNNALLKLSEQLKCQIQQLIGHNHISTQQYYKLQYQFSQQCLTQMTNKYKKLLEEHKKLKLQSLQNDTKSIKQYQHKNFQMQMKIKHLETENSYLEACKVKLQNQRGNLIHDLNIYQADNLNMKANMESKLQQFQKINQELKSKCDMLEMELDRVRGSNSNGSIYNVKIKA